MVPYCTTCICEYPLPPEHVKCFTDIQVSNPVINSKLLPINPCPPEQGVRHSLDQDIQLPAAHNQTHHYWDEDLTVRCLLHHREIEHSNTELGTSHNSAFSLHLPITATSKTKLLARSTSYLSALITALVI